MQSTSRYLREGKRRRVIAPKDADKESNIEELKEHRKRISCIINDVNSEDINHLMYEENKTSNKCMSKRKHWICVESYRQLD